MMVSGLRPAQQMSGSVSNSRLDKGAMMIKKFFISLFIIIVTNMTTPLSAANNDLCADYKKTPKVVLQKAEPKTIIKKSDGDIWPEAGFVNVKPFGTFSPQINSAYNSKYFCVYLESVDATVGFEDFEITIDEKYEKGSCEYNAVLEHENQHIKDSKKALDKVFPEIEDALKNVADSIMPIYVEDVDALPYAVDQIMEQINNDKRLKELVDEFKEQESRDAHALDDTPDTQLMKCVQDKVNSAFEKYYKKKKAE